MDSESIELSCNSCQRQLEENEKAVITNCRHIFCYSCAQNLVGSQQPCTVCDEALTKDSVRVVQVLQAQNKVQSQLLGQRPDLAMDAAKEALNFYMEQVFLARGYLNDTWDRRIQNVQQKCKEKLDSIFTHYRIAKDEVERLKKDMNEMAEKYQQRSRHYAELKKDNDSLRKRMHELEAALSNQRGALALQAGPAYPTGPAHHQHQQQQQHGLRHALGGPLGNTSPQLGPMGQAMQPRQGFQDQRYYHQGLGGLGGGGAPSPPNMNSLVSPGGLGYPSLTAAPHGSAGAAMGAARGSNQLRRVMNDAPLPGMGYGADHLAAAGAYKQAANRPRQGGNAFFNGAGLGPAF